jgi:hypothetical protein
MNPPAAPSDLPGRRVFAGDRVRSVLRVGVFLLWLAAAVYGSVLLWSFSLEPGEKPGTASRWPASSGLGTPAGGPKLVLFLHPMCPCSRATVEELAVLMAKTAQPLDVHAVFVGEAEGEPVEKSSLWRQVQTLPGVTLHRDPDGAEASRFHSATSGDAFLYDAEGALQYRGGLTAARGHAGDNFGVDSIVRIVNAGQPGSPVTGPVFGCLLANPQPPPLP